MVQAGPGKECTTIITTNSACGVDRWTDYFVFAAEKAVWKRQGFGLLGCEDAVARA